MSYVRDPDGQLIGVRVGTSTQATRYYFTFDGLGSVTGLTDATGARVSTYLYDPYGQLLSSSEGLVQPFRYTGGIHDSATGLTKLGIRYYDPALGRFTQPDPTGQDPHYTYAGNSPIINVDTTGADFWDFNASFGRLWALSGSVLLNEEGDWHGKLGAGVGLGAKVSGMLNRGRAERGWSAGVGACLPRGVGRVFCAQFGTSGGAMGLGYGTGGGVFATVDYTF